MFEKHSVKKQTKNKEMVGRPTTQLREEPYRGGTKNEWKLKEAEKGLWSRDIDDLPSS